MRPRPDATENRVAVGGVPLRHGVASMRPRPDATENARVDHLRDRAPVASMRPRPDATENGVHGAQTGLIDEALQ